MVSSFPQKPRDEIWEEIPKQIQTGTIVGFSNHIIFKSIHELLMTKICLVLYVKVHMNYNTIDLASKKKKKKKNE